MLDEKVKHTVKVMENILQRYQNDQKQIQKVLCKSFGDIEDVVIGAGDVHSFGDSVAILKGTTGKLVYKPHDLFNDIALNEVTEMLNGFLEFKLPTMKVMTTDEYGWQEYIEYKECSMVEEVQRYYYRLGAYLAIFYVLNSGDMHYENIICNGEHPYIIDTETLITINWFIQENNFDEAADNLDGLCNVISTCLLPHRNPSGVVDMDMSGLAGGKVDSKKIKSYHIENKGTDQLKVSRKTVQVDGEKNNVPKLNDTYVNPIDYMDDFMEGFEAAINVFMDNKNELLSWIESPIIAQTKQRQLFRHTYVYARFIEAGHHPSYLGSEEKRRELLMSFINTDDELESKRIQNEIESLFSGYIPLYYTQFASKDLWANQKVVENNFFNTTAQNTIRYKIASLTPKNIEYQKRLVMLSYFTLTEKPFEKGKLVEDKKKKQLGMDLAKEIVLKTIDMSVTLPPAKNKDFIMIRLLPECQVISGLSPTIYEGGGIILNTFLFDKVFNNQVWIQESLEWLKTAEVNYINSKNKTISVYEGIGSCMYLFFNLYQLTNDEEYYFLYRKYIKLLDEEIENADLLDYMHGMSGIIDLLLKIHEIDQASYILPLINKCIDKFDYLLEDNNNIPIEGGLAHGASGIAMVLFKLASFKQNRKYDELAIHLVDLEDNMVIDDISWCRGSTGIALARQNMLKVVDKDSIYYEKVVNQFHTYLQQVVSTQGKCDSMNMCMCHGFYGNIDVLNTTSKNEIALTDNEKIDIKKILEYANTKAPDYDELNLNISMNIPFESFMLGTHGISYSLLRLQNDKLPSVLDLDVYKA